MDGKYYIVSSFKNINYIKNTSKYFKTNLGFSVSVDMGDDKIVSDKDKFAFAWQGWKKSQVFSSGQIGDVYFYYDHSHKDSTLICIHEFEEFILELDVEYIYKHGMDSFIGKIIKQVDEDLQKMRDSSLHQEVEIQSGKLGDSQKVFSNPGQATYEDIQEYLKSKKIGRI